MHSSPVNCYYSAQAAIRPSDTSRKWKSWHDPLLAVLCGVELTSQVHMLLCTCWQVLAHAIMLVLSCMILAVADTGQEEKQYKDTRESLPVLWTHGGSNNNLGHYNVLLLCKY